MPLVKRTLAIFLRAELGFLGVTVPTLIHTPRLKGEGNLLGLFLESAGFIFKNIKTLPKSGNSRFFLRFFSWFFN